MDLAPILIITIAYGLLGQTKWVKSLIAKDLKFPILSQERLEQLQKSQAAKKHFTFVIGGDLGGQRYCKRVNLGYPIFSIMKALSPDFFIFNGDQIYGDDVCPATQGPEDVAGWYNVPRRFP